FEVEVSVGVLCFRGHRLYAFTSGQNNKDKLPGPPVDTSRRAKPGWRPRSASSVGDAAPTLRVQGSPASLLRTGRVASAIWGGLRLRPPAGIPSHANRNCCNSKNADTATRFQYT